MRTHIHGGRRRRPSEIPWLFVATIVGIVIVAGAAVIYFTSAGGSSAGHSSSSSDMIVIQSTTAPSGTGVSSATPTSSTPVVLATVTPPNIPATGVAVSVSYIGGFNGSYSTGGVTTTLTGSGSRMYEVANATGSVTATFQKTDKTVTHALTVGIYENGRQLATDSTSASYGKVTVTAKL
ncbi:hypothetical protein [Methanoregula sp.]|uniref:hypothetical protein n=1 Tax=Methanoregula sp. TaxID=2052170 RepID=UPI003BAF455D